MNPHPSSVGLLHQTVGGGNPLYRRINALLQSAHLKRFRAAVAYANWGGIGLAAEHIEALLKVGGEFQTIYGVGNGATTPDAMYYSLYLQKLYANHTYAGTVEDNYANAIFHPKFFEFKFPDKTIAIVGSANFTGGGFANNTELGVEIEVEKDSALEAELLSAWDTLKAESKPVTLPRIRALNKLGDLGTEQNQAPEGGGKKDKPFLKVDAKTMPKPLFAKVLGLKAPAKKLKILSTLDALSQKPDRLYLQILKYETGGTDEKPGYQIQLPKATLATFFGVGPNQKQLARFRFGNKAISTNITHFDNNTHRLRLMPLRDLARPAVVIFDRTGTNTYKCTVVAAKNYAKVLAAKCTEQTRAGARRWGLE
jgi:HKD family nuclease